MSRGHTTAADLWPEHPPAARPRSVFVVDLVCEAGHLFEGWYDHSHDFAAARDGGELSCPACGSTGVQQRPSFKGIVMRERSSAPTTPPSKGPTKEPTTAPSSTNEPTLPSPTLPLPVQRALSELLRVVRAHTEDVGDAFATTARAIHRGDEEARPIHGTATPDEHAELAEEGVPFVCIPIPDIDQN